MFMSIKAAVTGASVMIAGAASAGGHAAWSLDAEMSAVSFGSIKNDYTGESHGFESISGLVTEDGAVSVVLDLASVQTNIDIRNERMIEHVFGDAATAELTAMIDMAAMEALAVGDAITTEVDGTLMLLGGEVPLYVNMFILRIAEDQVLAVTDGMVFVSTEEAGVDAGVSILQELAGLDSITRVFPVSMRLMFNAG